jgi:hypothetical protein
MWVIGTDTIEVELSDRRSVIGEPWRIHDTGDSEIRPAIPEIQE